LIGLDTNIIVRYIMQDDPKQVAAAVEVIEGELSHDHPGFITQIVLVETIWVLRTVYGIPKAGLITVINTLLTTRQLRVEHSEWVYRALRTYRAGNADFSDALIAAVAAANGCSETLTFDSKAANVGMRLIGEKLR
jgi:predicted nucleic-acid-binding protein